EGSCREHALIGAGSYYAPRVATIAITGASGSLGAALARRLAASGARVLALTRAGGREPGSRWDPERGEIDAAALEGVDALVHLAGENVAGGRWSEAQKRRIEHSRVAGTTLLARTLAGLARKPSVLISASAVGYYGAHGADPIDESSPPGSDFLARICVQWEASAEPARQAGIRVVHPRFGLVMHPSGGALARMLPAFRLL